MLNFGGICLREALVYLDDCSMVCDAAGRRWVILRCVPNILGILTHQAAISPPLYQRMYWRAVAVRVFCSGLQ